MYIIIAILLAAASYFLGRTDQAIFTRLKKLEDKKPEVGATKASYGSVNEYMVNQAGQTGLVMPKTPQQLEWEEQEQLKKAQEPK